MENYLAEQERFLNKKLSYRVREIKFYYLKLNPLMSNYLAEQEKISFMLLIIDKWLMAIELSPKGRNSNITSQMTTP
jgi:hypothetical protein